MFPCDSAHASFSGVVTTIGPRLIEGLVETSPARPRHPVQATGTAGRLRRSACSPLCHSLREDNQGDCLDRASACPGEVCPRREPTLRRRRPAVPVAYDTASWTGWERLYKPFDQRSIFYRADSPRAIVPRHPPTPPLPPPPHPAAASAPPRPPPSLHGAPRPEARRR